MNALCYVVRTGVVEKGVAGRAGMSRAARERDWGPFVARWEDSGERDRAIVAAARAAGATRGFVVAYACGTQGEVLGAAAARPIVVGIWEGESGIEVTEEQKEKIDRLRDA